MRSVGKQALDESGKHRVNAKDEGTRARHSGAMRSIEPGISRFPDAQLRI
jgi:hypothetical protein